MYLFKQIWIQSLRQQMDKVDEAFGALTLNDNLPSFDTFILSLGRSVRVIRDTETKKIKSVSVHDIAEALGFSSRLVRRYAGTHDHNFERLIPLERYPNGEKPRAVKTPMISSMEHVRDMVATMASRTQQSAERIKTILESVGLDANSVQACRYVSMPEKDILDMLSDALPWNLIQQFKLGSYRIDAYIPEKRVAICCDENGHSEYDSDEEDAREDFIMRTLFCSVVRFDPILKADEDTNKKFFTLLKTVQRAVSVYDRRVDRSLARTFANLQVTVLYDRNSGSTTSESDVESSVPDN